MQFVMLNKRALGLMTTLVVVVLLMLIILAAIAGKRVNTVQVIPTATPPPTPTEVVQVVEADVYGQQEQILADMNGQTLYYFTKDAPHNVACFGSCTTVWKPLLFQGQGIIVALTSLPGNLKMEETKNGNQIAYNGHFLYTFSGDAAPGDIQGQGRQGKWFVVSPIPRMR